MNAECATRPLPATFDQLAVKIAGVPIKTHRVVSMFSGCGVIDLGFLGDFPFGGRYYDRLPFRIVWANVNNQDASQTYANNLNHAVRNW